MSEDKGNSRQFGLVQAAHHAESLGGEEGFFAECKDGSQATALKEEKERSGLPGIECSVCLNRPVQVNHTQKPQTAKIDINRSFCSSS